MKHQTNKIKAFTLSEIIIVLILTAIVVGLAFTILGLVQKHMLSIQKNYNTQTELNKLEASLWLDFNRFSKIEFDNIENRLKFKTEIDSVKYQFLDTKIVKDLDTFPIMLKQRMFFLNGKLVKQGQVDAIKIETQKQVLFVFKQNDATLFMN